MKGRKNKTIPHKFSGPPSKGFLLAHLRKKINQRAEFVLGDLDRGHWGEPLSEGGFDLARPIVVKGIFCGIIKRLDGDRSIIDHKLHNYPPDRMQPLFAFRDVVFVQDDKEAIVFGRDRRVNKKCMTYFSIREIMVWRRSILPSGDGADFLMSGIAKSGESFACGSSLRKEPPPPLKLALTGG